MALKFLQETNQGILGKIKIDLSYIDPSIDFDEMTTYTVNKLSGKLKEVRESLDTMRRGRYGSWLQDENFVRDSLMEEAIKTMIAEKRAVMSGEKLISGATYYTNVSRFGDILEGHYSIYKDGEKFTGWMPFRESVAVSKAMTVLRFGSEDDFREIYVGMADGRPDALNEVSMGHIVESSDEALAMIESYCDSRWSGPWPWETEAPETLKHMIESREEEHMKTITEMKRSFGKMLREFDEGGVSQYEIISASQEMMSKVDSIISDLGKLSSTGIEVTAQAKASGDDSLVEPMQSALGEPLNSAISALTDLKASLAQATGSLTSGGPAPDMGGVDDDLGSPADAMGTDPMVGGDDVDALADVDIAGDEEERPMKEV